MSRCECVTQPFDVTSFLLTSLSYSASLFVRNSLYVTPSLFFTHPRARYVYQHRNTRTAFAFPALKLKTRNGGFERGQLCWKRMQPQKKRKTEIGESRVSNKGETNENFVLLTKISHAPTPLSVSACSPSH